MEISPAATPSKLQAPSTAVGEQDVHVVNPHVQVRAAARSTQRDAVVNSL